jgi:hypothetical protein
MRPNYPVKSERLAMAQFKAGRDEDRNRDLSPIIHKIRGTL